MKEFVNVAISAAKEAGALLFENLADRLSLNIKKTEVL